MGESNIDLGIKISELEETSVFNDIDLVPVVQNGITKKLTKKSLFQSLTGSLGTAAFSAVEDFAPAESIEVVEKHIQDKANEQNERIDRVEYAIYLIRNNGLFKAYRTKAQMLTDVNNIPVNSIVQVVADPADDPSNEEMRINAEYHWNGTDFLKLPDGLLLLYIKIKEYIDQFDLLKQRKNVLWQGGFYTWDMGHAGVVSDVQRKHIPAGVTHARKNFEQDTIVYHVNGTHNPDALRVSRRVFTNSEATHNIVMNLTPDETAELAGERCVLKFHCDHGEDYHGDGIVVKVQYSRSMFQPIINDDGTYSADNNTIIEKAFFPKLQPRKSPYFLVFDVPNTVNQIALSIDIKFKGVAGYEDWVELEGVAMGVGTIDAELINDRMLAEYKARQRYQSSYPTGVARGSPTEQGALRLVSTNANAPYGLVGDIRFTPPMLMTPWFTFQSPTSGTEFRMLNKTTGANIFGQAYALSDKGVTVTNNVAVTAGQVFVCHYTAECII